MNVLVVKTSSLGDVIHTLPALTDAKNSIPDISFDWVVEEGFAEIPAWHFAVKSVIPIALRRWRKNLAQAIFSREMSTFLCALRQNKYDLIIDAQGLIKSAMIAKIAHGICCGYEKNSAREPMASFFYDSKFVIAKGQHAIVRNRQLFASVLQYEMPNSAPDYGISGQKIPSAGSNEQYLIFFHGTSREEKCWHEQKWLDLAQFATANGFIVYLPWGNSMELARAKRIAQGNNQIKVLSKLNLAAIAALLQSTRAVVAVDTGLGHLAVALGVPTISLYGPTDTKLIGTVGPNPNQAQVTNFEQVDAADVWQIVTRLTATNEEQNTYDQTT